MVSPSAEIWSSKTPNLHISVLLLGSPSWPSSSGYFVFELSSARNAFFFCAGLLTCLLLLHVGGNCSCALKRLSLKINQLSWAPLPSWAASQEQADPHKSKNYYSLKSTAEVLKLALFTSPRALNTRLPSIFISQNTEVYTNCLLPYSFQVKANY